MPVTYKVNTYDKSPQEAKNRVLYDLRTGKKLKRSVLKVKYTGRKKRLYTWEVTFKQLKAKRR